LRSAFDRNVHEEMAPLKYLMAGWFYAEHKMLKTEFVKPNSFIATKPKTIVATISNALQREF